MSKLLFLFSISILAISPVFGAADNSKSCSGKPAVENKDNDRPTFIIDNSITDLNAFTQLVKSASRFKKYGDVQINIAVVADKAFYEIPEGGNPWSEYASNFANLYKFYPDEKIAPYIPSQFVKGNRELLLAKAKILRENGMHASLFSNEPEIIPEAFFEAYPEYRGPRVDHPRRSNVPFFSPCLSVKGMQDMYAKMMADLLKNAPEIKSFFFKTNDAGSGNCWSDWLYSGPNGPDYCKNETTGERLEHLFQALQNGASQAGTKLDVYLSHAQGSSNFTDKERTDIQNHLPDNCYFASTPEHEIKSMGSDFAFYYPAKGILNVYSFLNSLERLDIHKKQYIFISLRAFYSRGNESSEVHDLMFKLMADYFAAPTDTSTTKQTLYKYCGEWAGQKNGDTLYHALLDLDEADKIRYPRLSNLYGIHWVVSTRFVTRPLVAAPQRLSQEEEAYFLPFVFNVSQEAAQMDYLDIHGGHWTTSPDSIKTYVEKITRVAKKLDMIDVPDQKNNFIRELATALKIHASLIRSVGNFAEAQQIRDRNIEKFNGPIHRPTKEANWTGDPDLLKFNNVMRDELDNTEELITVLENGGIGQICHADDQKHEDTFLLGPDLIDQLKKKCKIMLNHWRDIEDYMTSPMK